MSSKTHWSVVTTGSVPVAPNAPMMATNSNSGGSTSDSVTPRATDGPRLPTSIWYKTVPPGTASLVPPLMTSTSATASTSTLADAELFADTGSRIGDDAV